MNNNDEKIFEFPNEHMTETLDYPDYDLDSVFINPIETAANHKFNKSNTDLSKGLLNLAGINGFGTLNTNHGSNGSIVSKLDIGLEKDLLNFSGMSSILDKSSSVLGKSLQNSPGIKSNNVFNKSDIFNSNPLIFSNGSKEVPKPLILEENKNMPRKERRPVIEGIREMNKAHAGKEEKPGKLLQVIEDAIHGLERPGDNNISDLEKYIGQNNNSLSINKRIEELAAASKVLEEQIKGLKASNEYLEKQTFELADTNSKLNIQVAQLEKTTAEIIHESKKNHKIAVAGIIIALAAVAAEVLRVIF